MQEKPIMDLFKRNQESKVIPQELSDQKQQSQIRCKSPNRLDMSFNNGSVIQGHEDEDQSECSVIDQIKGTYPEEIPTIQDTDTDEDHNDVLVSDFTSNHLPSQIEKIKKIISKNSQHQIIILQPIDYPLYQFLDMSKQQMFYQPLEQLKEKLSIIDSIFQKKIQFYDDHSAQYKLSFEQQNELFVKRMNKLTTQKQPESFDFTDINLMIRNLQMYLKSNPIQTSLNRTQNYQISRISRIQLQQSSPVLYKKLNLKSMTLIDVKSNENAKSNKLEITLSQNEEPKITESEPQIDKQTFSKTDKASRVQLLQSKIYTDSHLTVSIQNQVDFDMLKQFHQQKLTEELDKIQKQNNQYQMFASMMIPLKESQSMLQQSIYHQQQYQQYNEQSIQQIYPIYQINSQTPNIFQPNVQQNNSINPFNSNTITYPTKPIIQPQQTTSNNFQPNSNIQSNIFNNNSNIQSNYNNENSSSKRYGTRSGRN